MDDSIEKGANDNLLGNKNPVHINSNIDIDIEAKLNLNKNITNGNLYKENSEINIKNLFQYVQDQIIYKRLTRKNLK